MRGLAVLLCLLALGACARPAPGIALAPAERPALTVTEVEFAYAPDRRVWWADAEDAYAAANGCVRDSDSCDYWAFVETPEAHAFLLERIRAAIEPVVAPALRGAWTGTRPARARVLIRQFAVVASAQKVVLGGSSSFAADLQLIDVQTGRELAVRRGLRVRTGGEGRRLIGLVQLAVTAAGGPIAEQLAARWAAAATGWMRSAE